MKRSLLVGLAALAALALIAAPAAAVKTGKSYKSTISVQATYDTATEIVSVTGKVTSPQLLCEKRREVLITLEPLDEGLKSLKANGKGEFKWSFHTNVPEEYKVQAFANTAKYERHGEINTCGKAVELVPIR